MKRIILSPRRALNGRKELVLTEKCALTWKLKSYTSQARIVTSYKGDYRLDGVCLPGEIPSNISVRRFFNKELIMTKK